MTQTPTPRGPNYMATTLIMLAVVGLLAVAISQGWLDLDEDPVHLTLTAPDTVTLPGDGSGDVPVMYTVSLKNNTDDAVLLQAATPCRIHRWFIADSDGNFVQGEPRESCADVVMNADLVPDSMLEDSNEIALDAARYQPGGRYQLMVSYWGYERVHVFTAE